MFQCKQGFRISALLQRVQLLAKGQEDWHANIQANAQLCRKLKFNRLRGVNRC